MSVLTSIALAATLSGAKAPPPCVAYDTFVHSKVRYHAVTADLSTGVISAETIMSGSPSPAWHMIGKEQPIAAITGTFFAPRGGIPIADVLVDGSLMAKGNRGSGVGVDHFGAVTIFDERFRSATDWANYRYGLRGAVRVVSNGRVQPNPKAQRFRDKRIWSKAARTGIGMTKSGKLVMLATKKPVTLSQFGKAMVSRGVLNGISLDGGGSTCLYFNGSMKISTQRKLVNLFVIAPRSPYSVPPTRIAATKAPMTITTIAPVVPNPTDAPKR